MGYRSKIITFFFLFSGKNGACCYTWGEERAIDSKKRTSCYSLLRFFISPPHNRLKVAFSHFFWLLLHSLKIIHKFATEKRIHSAKLIPFNIMKSSNINPSA